MSAKTELDQKFTKSKGMRKKHRLQQIFLRDLQFDKAHHYGMFLDLSYNRIEVVDILPARRVQAGGPMWQTINLEIKGGSDHFHNNRAVAEGDNVSFYAIFCVCKSNGKT